MIFSKRNRINSLTLDEVTSGALLGADGSDTELACHVSPSFEADGAFNVRGEMLFGGESDKWLAAVDEPDVGSSPGKLSRFFQRTSREAICRRSYSVTSAPDHLSSSSLEVIKVTSFTSLLGLLDRHCSTVSYCRSASGSAGKEIEKEFSSSWSQLPDDLKKLVVADLRSLFVSSEDASGRGLIQMASYAVVSFQAGNRQTIEVNRSRHSTAEYNSRPEVNSKCTFRLEGFKSHPKLDLFSLSLHQRTMVAMLLVQQVPFAEAISRVAKSSSDVSLWASMFFTFIADGFSTRDAWQAASNI